MLFLLPKGLMWFETIEAVRIRHNIRERIHRSRNLSFLIP
jgi:hypothetical protein